MKPVLNDKHEEILDAAEQLFSARGYNSVKLRDIASAVGIKHAALYYYVPDGKEQLFVDVMERSFQKHQQGMMAAVTAAEPDLQQQLTAVADWLLSHAPMNIAHMEQSDFSTISEANAQKLSTMIFDSLRLPLQSALAAAQGRGEISVADVDLAALSFIVLVESIHSTTNQFLMARKPMVIEQIIEMLLNGWRPR